MKIGQSVNCQKLTCIIIKVLIYIKLIIIISIK